MELFNTSTPEKAFKTSVRPLAVLAIFQGVGLLYIFSSWPGELLMDVPLPFIPVPFKKIFLISMAVLILIIGIGLLFRSRPIWYIFIAYIVIGPIWLISGMAFGYFPDAEPKVILIPIAILISALTAVGLYFVTKPAFK